MQTFILKPNHDLLVRDPLTADHLAEEGESKPRTSYWMRRLLAGDVQEVHKPSRKKTTKRTD